MRRYTKDCHSTTMMECRIDKHIDYLGGVVVGGGGNLSGAACEATSLSSVPLASSATRTPAATPTPLTPAVAPPHNGDGIMSPPPPPPSRRGLNLETDGGRLAVGARVRHPSRGPGSTG